MGRGQYLSDLFGYQVGNINGALHGVVVRHSVCASHLGCHVDDCPLPLFCMCVRAWVKGNRDSVCVCLPGHVHTAARRRSFFAMALR